MPKYLPLPDGNSVTIREGESPDQAWERAKQMYPASFGFEEEKKPEEGPGPQGGFMPALKSGFSSLKGDVAALAGKTGLMDEAAAEKYIAEQKKYQQKTFKPTEEGWTEAPVTKVKELLGGSLPYMAAPVAAAGAAAALPLTGAAATTAGLGATGLASLAQFTGSNLTRQTEEGKTLKEASLGKAAAAAIPQAALDVVSFKMMPGVRGILGEAGIKMTSAEAKAFAEQGVAKIAADYALATGKSMGSEGLTEAGQQFFERMQAGLNLTDPNARKEYWESLVGGAVLGGTLAPAGRYVERGNKQQEAKTLLAKEADDAALAQRTANQQAAAQKAADTEAYQQTGEYALKVQTEYEDAVAKMKALREASKDPGKDADPVAREEAKLAKADMVVFGKETMQPLAKQYAELKRSGVYVDLAKQQAAANMTPMEAMLAQRPQQVKAPALSAEGPATTPFTEMATSTATPMSQAQAYAQRQIEMANERSLTPSKDRGDQVGDYAQYLLQNPVMATQLVQNSVRLPGLNTKMNQAVLTTLRDTLKMQRAAGQLDNAGNRLRPQEVPAAQQAAESEEAQALEASRQAEEQQRIDAEKERQLAPEKLALQRIKNRPNQTVGLPGFGTAPEEKKGSPVIGQMEQSLRGVVPGQELLFTAEETPQPAKAQKGPGGGFRLFNEQGERQLTDAQAYRNLSERLAIASSDPDLSDEAYNFLRRAETILPQVNTRLETARKEPVKKGEGTLAAREYAEDVASSESLYKLLDEQLARIERGEEGVYQSQRYVNQKLPSAKGTAAGVTPSEVATPYQLTRQRLNKAAPTDLKAEKTRISKLKNWPKGFEQPEGERAVANVPGAPVEKRERQTTGRTIRGEAPTLSMAAELEPLIRAQEQARGQGPIAEGQKELFGDAAETARQKAAAAKGVAAGPSLSLGIQRANFKALMNSKVVQKLREALDSNKKVTAVAKSLPQMQAQVKKLQAEVDRMEKINLEYSAAARTIQVEKDLGNVRRSMVSILGALNNSAVESMQLEGRVETLKQLRGELIQEGKALGESVELPLLADLNENEIQLERAQNEVAEIRGALETLKGQLRVQEAKATLAKLNPQTVPKEALESAKEKLRAAQLNAGVAEAEIRKVELASKAVEAKAKREAEAVERAEKEKNRINVDKEYQRRLEAAYGTSATGQEYEIITMAQREAQEMRPVAFTVEEQKKIHANPNAVLAGYRSRISGLEKIMQASYAQSKEFNDKKLVPTGETVEQLLKAYNAAKTDDVRATLKYKLAATRVAELSVAFKNAKSADERAALEPKLEAAEREYDEQASNLQDEPIIWKGRAGQMKELTALYNKAEQLEADINAGRVVQAKDFQRKSPTLKPSTGEKEAEAANAQATEVKEATQRATAPTTTGDAGVTRMEATKLNKPTSTVYSNKGAGPETLSKDQKDALARIKEKQAAGKSINDFEKALLDRVQRMEGILRSANNPPKGTDATMATSSVQTPITEAGKEALADSRTLDVLRDIVANSSVPFIRENAEKLLPFVSRTRIMYSPDIVGPDGEAVPAAYNSEENAVGVRPGYESESNIVHELTHAATMRALEGPEEKLNEDQLDAKREITRMFNVLTENGTLSGQYAAKNVKEFVSEVQSNVDLREKLGSTKIFGSTALRKIADYLMQLIGIKPSVIKTEEAQAVIERLYMQSGKIKGVDVAPNIFSTPKAEYGADDALSQLAKKIVAQPKSFQERLGKNMTLEAEMEVVDMRAAIREFTNIGSKAFNNDKQFTQAMASVLKADQYMPLVSASLESGPLEMYEDSKGLRQVKSSGKDSAVDVFKAVEAIPAGNSEGKFALASAYMIAQRAANKGLTALDLGALKVDQADLDAALAAAEADPKLKAALENVREKYNAYNAGQIKFLASTGYISKATAKDWLKDGDYVPYYRVREDGTAELVLGGEKTITIGDVRHQPYLAELKGGETKILPLSESIMRNTMLITKAGMSNLAAKELAYAMQMIGKGAGPIDPKTGLAKNLMAITPGQNPGGSDIIVFKQEPDPKNPKDDGQRYVRVQTEGTVAEGIPSALLVRSLEGAHLTLPAFLKVGGIAGDLLRKGVTRMPPYILRQLYRDPMAASFTAGLNYGPFTAVAKAGKEFIASSRGESKTNAELIKKGLVQSGIYTGDPDDMSAFALQLASGKGQGTVDKFLAMLDRAAIRADSATRSLVYDNAIANGLSEVEADMMVMESMNFYKRGLSPTVQYANRLIPFMNAQIQGLNVLYKAATGKMPFNEQQQIKRKFYNNALVLFATGFAYALAMEDDDTFKNAKPRDKYSNFFVNLPGVDEPLKIAIPYEAGWFFSAAVAAVDAVKAETDNKQQFEAIRDMFLGAVPGYSSKFVPQAVKPLFEVFTNKSFFSGNNIESMGMQGKTADQRYNTSTTEGAKMLASVIPGLSPIQIDYLAKAYLGAAPILALQAAGSLFEKDEAVAKPEKRLSENAVFGSMFQRKFGGADADVVYQLAQDATQVQTTFNSMKKTGAPADVRDYLEEHRAELAAAPAARRYISNMGKLKTQEEIITNRLNLSAEEKRQRLNQLDETRQSISKQYMQAIKKIESQF
jgi:hypothetical protein